MHAFNASVCLALVACCSQPVIRVYRGIEYGSLHLPLLGTTTEGAPEEKRGDVGAEPPVVLPLCNTRTSSPSHPPTA